MEPSSSQCGWSAKRAGLAVALLAVPSSKYAKERLQTPIIYFNCNFLDSIHFRMLPCLPNLGTSGSSCFTFFLRAFHFISKLANVRQLMLDGVISHPTLVYYLVALAATMMRFFDVVDTCIGFPSV